MAGQNSSQLWHQTPPLSGETLPVSAEAYPFHDGWNIACFVILLLFILAVVSLAALAFLYELLDCGCCAKEKMASEQPEEPGLLQDTEESVNQQHAEAV